MKVELVEYTPNAEALCAAAMKLCHVPDKDSFMDMYRSFLSGHYADAESKIKEFISLALKLGHESVLEHASFTFYVEGVSRALTHQLVRHRIASYSQQSQRHVDISEPSFVIPESFSGKKIVSNLRADGVVEGLMKNIWDVYSELIKSGVPLEDARFVLPNACTTKIVITMNARELRHFFKLRCSKHAQWEIREMACRMLKLCNDVAPIIFRDLYMSYEEYPVTLEEK